MADALSLLVAVTVAYMLGSLSFAVLVSRVMGLQDPRTFGSGNPGATNVLRSGSKLAAILTLVLDALKGWLPVWWVAHSGAAWGLGAGTLAAVALAAFLGHLYPLYFRFKGGKGVATALGVLLGLNPWLALAAATVWLVTAVTSRYSSLASLLAAVAAPGVYVLAGGSWWLLQPPLALAISAMSMLLIYKHAGNIERLLRGQESRIGAAKKPR